MTSSIILIFLAIFYFLIFFFALSDFKQFLFHIRISRVDRTPVTINVDESISLWYPIVFGIGFNVFIGLFSLANIILLLRKSNRANRLNLFTFILFLLLTIRLIVNLILTQQRNGLSTPSLVERSFLASSLSFEEEITTLILNYLIKFVGLFSTFLFAYRLKQEGTMSVERKHETKLMSSFD